MTFSFLLILYCIFSTGVWYTESSGDNLLIEITLKVQPGTGDDQPGGYAKVNGTTFGVQYIHHAYVFDKCSGSFINDLDNKLSVYLLTS